jgi:prepilin-type N-terminal cleavage/methylation domain-containing protein
LRQERTLPFNMNKQIKKRFGATNNGFTIIEVVVALTIIVIICSTVMLVIKNDMIQLGESSLRMEAFEVARENMENLLTASSVSEMDDFGTSDKNPNIEWETIVEPFSAEGASKMWVRAICSATYSDANAQPQKIELTHWLTDISDDVAKKMMKDKEKLSDMNEPNMPADANSIAPAGQLVPNTSNPNIDEATRKIIEGLLNKK